MSLRFQFTLGEALDTDNDGVTDNLDECINVYGTAENNGCRYGDADDDGVKDDLDECINVSGPAENYGCPYGDADDDGVKDNLDECINESGPAENNGCPYRDADDDGVTDNLDDCINESGPAENNGCPLPDTDDDGVPDNLDECINESGPAENKGCPLPDTDEDGVPDINDICPNSFGSAANYGCPEIDNTAGVIDIGVGTLALNFFDSPRYYPNGSFHPAQVAEWFPEKVFGPEGYNFDESDGFICSYKGFIYIEEAGIYTFVITSSNGVDPAARIVANDASSNPGDAINVLDWKSSSIELGIGYNSIGIEYRINNDQTPDFSLKYQLSGTPLKEVPFSILSMGDGGPITSCTENLECFDYVNNSGIKAQHFSNPNLTAYGTIPNYALLQEIDGTTHVNAGGNKPIIFSHNQDRVAMKLDYNSTTIYGNLNVTNNRPDAHDPNTKNQDSFIDNAVAHFDGRVYISEEDDLYEDDNDVEKGFDDKTKENYKNFLLWVEKGIVTNEFAMVDVQGFPDYVFEEMYTLKSLEEVEAFIKKYKHLPNMLPGKHIEENGFTVKDMTLRLVKTIEELTLYTIEQQDLIENRNQSIEALELRINKIEALFKAYNSNKKNKPLGSKRP
jgi:hypothetical protein